MKTRMDRCGRKLGRLDGFLETNLLIRNDCTFLGATSSRRRISLPCLRVQFVYDAVQEAVKYTNIARHS